MCALCWDCAGLQMGNRPCNVTCATGHMSGSDKTRTRVSWFLGKRYSLTPFSLFLGGRLVGVGGSATSGLLPLCLPSLTLSKDKAGSRARGDMEERGAVSGWSPKGPRAGHCASVASGDGRSSFPVGYAVISDV